MKQDEGSVSKYYTKVRCTQEELDYLAESPKITNVTQEELDDLVESPKVTNVTAEISLFLKALT